jgi:hypothetical protein
LVSAPLGPDYDRRCSRFGRNSCRHASCFWGLLVPCAPCASSICTERHRTHYSWGRAGVNRHELDAGTSLHPLIGNVAKLVGNYIRAVVSSRRTTDDNRTTDDIRTVDDIRTTDDIRSVVWIPAVPSKNIPADIDVGVVSGAGRG